MATEQTTATDEKVPIAEKYSRGVAHTLAAESATVSVDPLTTWSEYQAIIESTRTTIDVHAEGDL